MWRAIVLNISIAAVVMLSAGPTLAQRFSIVANGEEILDTQTGLVWRRCALGMAWNGSTCEGSPSSLVHQDVLGSATQAAGWRLPNVKELFSIVALDRSPRIDAVAFPATPGTRFLTVTPFIGSPDKAWCVDFGSGTTTLCERFIFGTTAARFVR